MLYLINSSIQILMLFNKATKEATDRITISSNINTKRLILIRQVPVLCCVQLNTMASRHVTLVRVYRLCLQKENGQLGLFLVLVVNQLPHGLDSLVQLTTDMVIEQKAIESGHFRDTASVG